MLEVRHAQPSDAVAVAALAREIHQLHALALPEVFQPATATVVTADDIERLGRQPGQMVLVARLDGEVVGYAHAEVQEVPPGPYKRASAMLHVHAMGVTASTRRRGVGHALLQAVRREAAQRGLTGVSLEVYGFNEAARAFYEREGFGLERQRLVWTPGAHRPLLDSALRAPHREPSVVQSGTIGGLDLTDGMRRIFARAHEEAARLDHEYVGTEHFLLSLIRESDGPAARVFADMGVDEARVVAKIEAAVKRGRVPLANRERLPFTSRAKKVIELALAEARTQHHAFLGGEHLLLGLIREEKGIAAQILAELGMRLDETRREVLRMPGSDVPREPSSERIAPADS